MKKELVNNTKRWGIETKGKSHTVQYGKVDGKLKSNEKTFDTEEACEKDAEKLIKSKIKGGYIELTLHIKGVDLSLLYRIEQVQRGNATIIDEDKLWEDNAEVLAEICKCVDLEFLDLKTELNIPKEFGNLVNLQKLNVSAASIPEELGNLVNLKTLRLSVPDESTIPSTIKNLKKLEDLDIDIKSYGLQSKMVIPDEIGELSSLKTLKIYAVSLVPDAICSLSNLEFLNLRSCGNTELPNDLGNLLKLKKLQIEGFVNVRTIPASIGNLKNLEELIINHFRNAYTKSQLSGLVIPKEIGKLSSLIKLNLEENGIESFPEGICNLTNLKELEMDSDVAIKYIPEEFVNLVNLEDFSIKLSKDCNIPSQFIVEGFGFNSVEPESIIDYLKNQKKEQKPIAEQISVKAPLKVKIPAKKKASVKEKAPVLIPEVPSNKEELVKRRERKIFPNLDSAYDDYKRKAKVLKDFFIGESQKIPVAQRRDVDDYEEDLVDILNPLREWDFIDQRVFLFICQDAFYYPEKNRFIKGPSFSGYHYRLFKNWFLPQLEQEEKGQNLLGDLFELLINAGIEESICFEAFLAGVPSRVPFRFSDSTPNSAGQYILNSAKKDLEGMTDLILKHRIRGPFIELMRDNAPELLDKSLPKLLYIGEYLGTGGSNKHIPFHLLELVFEKYFEKYEHYIHELMAQTDCHECIMECHRILLEHNEKEYREITLSKIKETLSIISEKLSDDASSIFSWSVDGGYGDNTPQFIDWALDIYGEELKETVTEYVENTRIHNLRTTRVIVNHFGEGALDIIQHDFKVVTTGGTAVEYYRDLLNIVSRFDYSIHADKIWKLAADKKTAISEMAALELARLDSVEVKNKALDFLKSKKDKERLAAVRVLYFWRDEESLQALQSILKTEEKDVIREIAVSLVYGLKDVTKVTIPEMKERIQDTVDLKKIKTKIVKWQSKLPALNWSDGTPFTQKEIDYIFYRQSQHKTIMPDVEAQPIYHLVEKESAEEFAKAWWELIVKKEGLSLRPKGLLAPIGLLGGEELIDSLAHEALKNKKSEACELLGLLNTEAAAWALDKVIKVNEPKQNGLFFEGEAAFASIAENLGLTAMELQERMLPDFGFTERELEFTENGNVYSLFIDTAFKFSYKNEKGKVIKSIAKASADFKQEQKESSVLLKTVIKQFSQSLNRDLVTQKFWLTEDWQSFFLAHPVAFAFAQNSVWTNGKSYFIADSNAELVDIEGDSFELEKGSHITLAHPILMGENTTKKWMTYLEQKDLASPFDQLTRDIHTLSEDLTEVTMGEEFDTKEVYVGSFRYRATKAGWRRGLVVGGGSVTSYQKAFEADNIEAFIETNDLPVREGHDEKMKAGRLYFVPLGSVRTDSYVNENPYDEKDERLIPFKEVPPIVFSETMADLIEITKDY